MLRGIDHVILSKAEVKALTDAILKISDYEDNPALLYSGLNLYGGDEILTGALYQDMRNFANGEERPLFD